MMIILSISAPKDKTNIPGWILKTNQLVWSIGICLRASIYLKIRR